MKITIDTNRELMPFLFSEKDITAHFYMRCGISRRALYVQVPFVMIEVLLGIKWFKNKKGSPVNCDFCNVKWSK